MAQAIQQHIFPMVEHSGDVMVDIYPHSLEVSLIDADACHRWEEDHTEMDVLVQLGLFSETLKRTSVLGMCSTQLARFA